MPFLPPKVNAQGEIHRNNLENIPEITESEP